MRRAILVWARLRFGGHQLSSVELGEIAERLGSASGATSLTALLVEPAEKGSEVGIVERFSMPSSSGNRLEIAHAMVPLRLDRSGESFADLLRGVLVERGAR